MSSSEAALDSNSAFVTKIIATIDTEQVKKSLDTIKALNTTPTPAEGDRRS
jgi:hypothetical protein